LWGRVSPPNQELCAWTPLSPLRALYAPDSCHRPAMCAHAPHVFNVITPLGPGPGDRQFDDDSPGVISRGNAVPIVKVFKNALWTALRTIFWRKCTRLQDFACTVSKRFRCEGFPVLGPRQQFSPCSPAFPLFLFYEMTTADSPDIRVCVCVCVCASADK